MDKINPIKNTQVDFYQEPLLNDDHFLVYKRNELIHGKFDLSVFSQKVLAALIARIDPRRNHLPEFEFSVPELAQILGVSKQRVYDCIDEITTELQSQVVKLLVRDKASELKIEKELEAAKKEGRPAQNFVHKKNNSFDKFNWFEISRYRQNEGIIRFKFHNEMENYLLDFNSNFTRYSLPNVLKMNSKYSIRLYEMFRSFLSVKAVKSGTKSIFRVLKYEDLREILGINPQTLTRFYDFERFVLKQAKKELDITDLGFSYSFPERQVANSRKKVTKIQFHLYAIEQSLVGNDWHETLLIWVTKSKAKQLITKYGETVVKRNVELVASQIEDGRDIRNIVAYITKAIKLDYAFTDAALDPYSYSDQLQRDFVKQQLLPYWEKLSEQDQNDFLVYRFAKGMVSESFEKFKNESGQRSISAAIMDQNDLNW